MDGVDLGSLFRRTDTVRALLEKGANVNAKGKDGMTALMNAASADYRDIVHSLLEKGADVNAKDNDGWTPLFWQPFRVVPILCAPCSRRART